MLYHFCTSQLYTMANMGVSETSVPLNPMVFMIIIPIKNGYFIGNINPTFSVTNPYGYAHHPNLDPSPIPSLHVPQIPRAPHRSAAAQRPSAASSSVSSSHQQQLCGFRSSPQPVAKARPSTDNLRESHRSMMGKMGMNHDGSLSLGVQLGMTNMCDFQCEKCCEGLKEKGQNQREQGK